MKNYGCKSGLPHDLEVLHDFSDIQIEVCTICGKKYRYPKANGEAIDNKKYLADHIRAFAQPNGVTHELFMRLYHPEDTKIKISPRINGVNN